MAQCIAKRGMRRCPLEAGHDGDHEFDPRSDYGMDTTRPEHFDPRDVAILGGDPSL